MASWPYRLYLPLCALLPTLAACPALRDPQCLSLPQTGACNEPTKQATLKQIVLGELGTAKRKDLIEVEVALGSLSSGDGFYCQVSSEGMRPGSLNFVILPPLRCTSPSNGEPNIVRCAVAAGDRKAVARISLAGNSTDALYVSFICTPDPANKQRSEAHPPGVAAVRPGHGASHGEAPAPHRRTAQRSAAPPRPALDRTLPAPSPSPPDPVPDPVPAAPPPAVAVPPRAPAAAPSFGIRAVGELPHVVVTLNKCDDPRFINGAVGRYSVSGSGLHGRFQVGDSEQCEMTLLSGVASEDQLNKIQGRIAVQW